MIVAIQQPEHLPWLGFFDKMRKCDLYIFLDNVQFKKRYFENRNKILTADGSRWITVPVLTKGSFTQNINEVLIDNSEKWRNKYLGTLQRAYSKTAYFDDFFPMLEKVIGKRHDKLLDLNLELINVIRDYFEIDTQCEMASDIVSDDNIKGSDLILELCVRTRTDTYISGPDGMNYLNLEKFQKAGIEVVYHDYEHPVYKQRYEKNFISHMSITDLIFNNGNNLL